MIPRPPRVLIAAIVLAALVLTTPDLCSRRWGAESWVTTVTYFLCRLLHESFFAIGLVLMVDEMMQAIRRRRAARALRRHFGRD